MNKNNNYFEIIVGTFVLLCATFFFLNSFKSSKLNNIKGYHLIAKFDNISGIEQGSDIKIAGVKIGTVENQFLDEKTYRATLKLMIHDNIKLAADSSAKISSEGLLGSKFLSIELGAEDEILKDGEEIRFTQSSVNFEELLGKFIFNSTSNKKDGEDDKK